MRTSLLTLSVAALLIAGCGGGGAATQAPVRQTTAPAQAADAPGQPTTEGPGQPTTAPPPGGGGGATATVTLTGGPDAGTYSAEGNPNCSYGLVGQGIWGAQFSVDAGEGELSSVQFVWPEPNVEDAHFSVSVSIGPLLSGNTYSIRDEEGTGEATRNGSGAVLHGTGTDAEGVTIDATVNCPAVMSF
jgi:hypothetical protein